MKTHIYIAMCIMTNAYTLINALTSQYESEFTHKVDVSDFRKEGL